MSVPAPREPRSGGWWEAVIDAIQSNPKTFRLCLIILVAAVPSSGLITLAVEQLRHLF
jgi:hypothetical protein